MDAGGEVAVGADAASTVADTATDTAGAEAFLAGVYAVGTVSTVAEDFMAAAASMAAVASTEVEDMEAVIAKRA